MHSLSSSGKEYLLKFIFTALACTAAAGIGFLLLPAGASSTLVWPPSAVALALLFLYGYDLWPAVLLSMFWVFVWRNGNIPLDFFIALADTLEAFLGAYFLHHYLKLNPLLSRLRDGLGMLIASTLPAFLSSGIIAFTLFFLNRFPVEQINTQWFMVWIGHAVSALCFAPFLIRWMHRPSFYKTRAEVVEGVILFGSIILLNWLMFWTPYGSLGSVSLIYILLIPLIWAALRAGPRGMTLALALTALVGISGIFLGASPLSIHINPNAVFLLQILLGALTMIFLLFSTIVEERKEAVLELEDSVGKLERAIEKIKSEDQAKSNFLAILAHELRNPLSPIVTSVELLKGTTDEAERQRLLDTVESHTRSISLLLDDLLDITRITQNKFELRFETVVLQQVVTRSYESVSAFLNSRGHKVEFSMPEHAVEIDADPLRLEQMLINLLNNSGKYTDPGGTIKIQYSEERGMAVLKVSDNGIGIAKEKLPGVFEPFGQIGAVMRRPGGLGVGLSLTKRLVELHGGRISAHSEGLGHGSTFTIRLPLRSRTETRVFAKRTRSFVGRFTTQADNEKLPRRILVVDDNEPAAVGLAKLLEREGHTTSIAQSGTEALSRVEHWKPTVVILDIGLPDIDGYEVGKRIRANKKDITLLALTGYGQEEDRAKSTEAGFDAHLVKPVSLADITKALLAH